jgi:hypothetical protein
VVVVEEVVLPFPEASVEEGVRQASQGAEVGEVELLTYRAEEEGVVVHSFQALVEEVAEGDLDFQEEVGEAVVLQIQVA